MQLHAEIRWLVSLMEALHPQLQVTPPAEGMKDTEVFLATTSSYLNIRWGNVPSTFKHVCIKDTDMSSAVKCLKTTRRLFNIILGFQRTREKLLSQFTGKSSTLDSNRVLLQDKFHFVHMQHGYLFTHSVNWKCLSNIIKNTSCISGSRLSGTKPQSGTRRGRFC